MNSKFLHFLFVAACVALIGSGSLHAQSSSSSSSGNGSAVAEPARHSDASHSAVAPSSTPNANDANRTDNAAAQISDSQDAANTAVANDRGTVPASQASTSQFNMGWIGLLGLLGLLGLVRRESVRHARRFQSNREREDYPRAA